MSRAQLRDDLAAVVHDLGCISAAAGAPDHELCNRYDGDGDHLVAEVVLAWLPNILEKHPEAFADVLGMKHRRDTGLGKLVGVDTGNPMLFHDALRADAKWFQRHVMAQPWSEVPSERPESAAEVQSQARFGPENAENGSETAPEAQFQRAGATRGTT